MTNHADCMTALQAYDAMIALLRRYVREFNSRGSLEDFLLSREYTALDDRGAPRTLEADAWGEWLAAIRGSRSSVGGAGNATDPDCLTTLQAYDAMIALLSRYVEQYRWRGTLHQFYLMHEYADLDEDGTPQALEPAAWNEWLASIESSVTD